jgi:diacylglycerol kinase family enzyme
MAVLNAYAEGGGVKMAPGAKMNDNLFNICGAHGMTRIRGFMTLPSLARGNHKGKRGIHTDETYSFTLKTSSPMVVHTDGEDMGERDYMHVECLFDAIRMV